MTIRGDSFGHAVAVSPTMKLAMLSLFLLGCGNVTPFDAPDAADVGRPSADLATDVQAVNNDSGRPASDVAPSLTPDAGPAHCRPDEGCASCLAPSAVGAGYRTIAQCVTVLDCVQAGDAGAFPWQSCHNLAGGGDAWAGLQCAMSLLSSCPSENAK